MPAASADFTPENSQYHHYVPQFILRNFTHRYRSPTSNGRGQRQFSRGKSHSKSRLYPGEQVLHVVDLSDNVPKLTESSIRRSFGLTDMYRDFSRTSNQHELEQLLSKLESRASMIITRIRKEFESGNQGVWISRPDRNMLRKFLFIMKYRGKGFHKRFVGDETQGYTADDKETFLKYMHEKGFRNPLDVWYHSIKTILELKMDLQGGWRASLANHMYPEDAQWFIMHTEMMYLAICTPSSTDTDFILTENCYNIFEGPNTVIVDSIGERTPGPWTSYHEFSPVSPKLMIVLRSFLLPNAEEDMSERIKEWRETMYTLNVSQHFDPSSANSKLADLPISKARNSYLYYGAQGVTLLDGEDGSRRSYHQFYFPFFKISADHVHTINSIMLDNAQDCQAIAFSSPNTFKLTVERYLTLPADQGFKHVANETCDPKLIYLRKLEHVLRQLGSHERLVYHLQTAIPVYGQSFEITEESVARFLPEQPTEFMQRYMKLGGSGATMLKDMDQARRMVKMRIKIDVWSQGLDESKRENIRENVRDFFCQLPARRLWYYLKQLRVMLLKDNCVTPRDVADGIPEQMDGPEDVIVEASHVIQPEKLGRLMHFSVIQQLFLMRNPEVEISGKITQISAGTKQRGQLDFFGFGQAGSICDCGVNGLQERSRLVTTMLHTTLDHAESNHSFWTKSQEVEMRTRYCVREDMKELLGDQLPGRTLQELKGIRGYVRRMVENSRICSAQGSTHILIFANPSAARMSILLKSDLDIILMC